VEDGLAGIGDGDVTHLALAAEGIDVVPFCDVKVLNEHQSLSSSASKEQFCAEPTVTATASRASSVHQDSGVADSATRRRFIASHLHVTRHENLT